MTQPDDNKVKSISYLVRSLIVLTLLVVGLVIGLLCYSFSKDFSEEHPPEFRCAVVAPCGNNTGSKNYTFNGKDGRMLFKTNCASCHTASEKRSTGPGLKGVLDRIPGGDWKYIFVRDHDSLFNAGDPYAVQLHASYKSYPYSGARFPQLTNDEIDAILLYVH